MSPSCTQFPQHVNDESFLAGFLGANQILKIRQPLEGFKEKPLFQNLICARCPSKHNRPSYSQTPQASLAFRLCYIGCQK